MKIGLSILLVIAGLASLSHAADPKPGPDAVVVKVLDTPLPHEENLRPRFLWKTFANKPEESQFKSHTADRWEDNFALFAKTLVQKARDQQLDSECLRRVLDRVWKQCKGGIPYLKSRGHRTAHLPVGAYQTTLDGQLIWIVIVRWEGASGGNGEELGHLRMFAFEQKTLKLVAHTKCK